MSNLVISTDGTKWVSLSALPLTQRVKHWLCTPLCAVGHGAITRAFAGGKCDAAGWTGVECVTEVGYALFGRRVYLRRLEVRRLFTPANEYRATVIGGWRVTVRR